MEFIIIHPGWIHIISDDGAGKKMNRTILVDFEVRIGYIYII